MQPHRSFFYVGYTFMTFQIRLATEADTPALDRLYRRSYPRLLKPDYAPSLLVTIVPMFSKAQPRLIASHSYFVAETETGSILGAGGWTPKGPKGEAQGGIGHIRHFATDPDALRLGVGTALMEACISQAIAHGIEHLSCYSTITAAPFYEAMGFVRKGVMDIEFGSVLRFPTIWLDRPIP